eukprot:PhF_6_TR21693/c0_g1_i2/m.30977
MSNLHPLNDHAIIIVSSYAVFFVTYLTIWYLSQKFTRTFRTLSIYDKGDWCSRGNSTLHALIIVPGFIGTTAATTWDDNFEPISNPAPMHFFMCISIAYFAFDFVVCIVFQLPNYGVFLAHHIFASIPYGIHLFRLDCRWGAYPLSLYLIVEIATLTLNLQSYLVQTGRENWKMCRNLFYATYVLWLLSRVGLPLYVLYIMFKYTFLPRTEAEKACLIPDVICGFFIAFFCISVFFGVLTKQLWDRWNPPQEVVAKIEEVCTPVEPTATPFERKLSREMRGQLLDRTLDIDRNTIRV